MQHFPHHNQRNQYTVFKLKSAKLFHNRVRLEFREATNFTKSLARCHNQDSTKDISKLTKFRKNPDFTKMHVQWFP